MGTMKLCIAYEKNKYMKQIKYFPLQTLIHKNIL